MLIIQPHDGYKALAEAVIRSAMGDLRTEALTVGDDHYRYIACLFFLSEECFDFWAGLAPNMTRDWERTIPLAKEVLAKDYKDGDPSKRSK